VFFIYDDYVNKLKTKLKSKMRERKLKEQFSTVTERLRRAQLTAEQLSALQSIQCICAHNGEQRRCSKLKTTLIASLVLLFIAAGLILSSLSQLSTILFGVYGLQVKYVECCFIS